MAAPVQLSPIIRAPRPEAGPGVARVVVGTDFSLDSDGAVRRAAMLPYVRGARVIIAHVLPRRPDRGADSIIRGAAEAELATAARKLQAGLTELGQPGVTVETRLLRGRAPEELARLASSENADVICVGRRGQSRLSQMLLGSTAQHLVRLRPGSVLVVGLAPRAPYKRAIVGFDLSPDALRAAKLARKLIPRPEGITAAHAVRDPLLGIPLELIGSQVYVAARAERQQVLKDRSKRVRRALDPLGLAKKRMHVAIKLTDPRQMLLDLARQKKAELVAVGSAGKGRLVRAAIGSVAEAVLIRAACDVLVVTRRRLPL